MMDWNNPTPRNRGAESWLVGLTLVGGLAGLGQPALAQNLITPDASLGAEASVVTPFGPLDVITGGAQRGANLFHSFGEFNIDSGYGAAFLTPVGDVASIFARVTGPNPSQILGVLGTRQGNLTTPSTANLFLINPNGMVFGPGASLDMAGSFYATTADSIQFGREGLFSALDPTTNNLLTINPSALWFSGLRPPAPIAIQGDPAIPLDLRIPIQLAPGAGLSLIGGPVLIDAKGIAAPGGRVDILALDQGGAIGLGPTGVVVPGALQRSDITLRNGAVINTIAGGGGDITLYGRDLSLDQGSGIATGIGRGLGSSSTQGGNIRIDSTGAVIVTNGAQLISSTFGTGDGGNVEIIARDQVVFDGTTADGQVRSAAISSLQTGAEGQGGDVLIQTGSLEVTNGARLLASTLGNGDAGSIKINARDRIIFDGTSAAFSSIQSGADGQGGNVVIQTGSLEVTNGAQLIASTSGSGDAGNIEINARNQVVFDGTGTDGQVRVRSAAFSSVQTGAEGQGGNVLIQTGSLEVTNGARLIASTSGNGDAGNIEINARDLTIFDGASAALSGVGSDAEGQGGNVLIQTGSLVVSNRAQLNANTRGNGDAGNIKINARDRVIFDGSAALSGVGSDAEGQGGNVQIATGSLEIINGAALSADTLGSGNAGNIQINARDQVVFDGTGATAFSSVGVGAEGQGGNVVIQTGSLEVANGAQLIASTRGNGDAGNVEINARDRVVFNGTSSNGQFSSGAFSSVEFGADGKGGNVVIQTDSLEVTNDAQLNANTRGNGNAGNIDINARDRIIFDNGSSASSSVEFGAEGQGGNVQITTGSLTVANGAQLVASTLGTGDAGNIDIVARDQVTLQGSGSQGDPSGLFTNNTETSSGQAKDITLTAPRLLVQDGAVILASTVNEQPGGNVTLDLGRLEILRGGQVVTSTLGGGPAGTIRLNARDGILIAGRDPSFESRAAQIPVLASVFTPESALSVRSGGGGVAGNIIIGDLGTTPRLELTDGGRIIAESAAVDGGNISLNLNTLLLLRRGGLISATAGTAQAGGNGGNISITAPFIVAIPSENSDIAADAFAGAGGNIRITARGIFGIEPRPQRTPLSDITASSELGITGSVVLNTLDTGFIENSLAALQDVVTDPDSLILGSCIARQDEGLGSFLVTGNGGLPHRPGDPGISTYPTGVVRSSLESTAFTEADGVYQLPDGRLVLSHACR